LHFIAFCELIFDRPRNAESIQTVVPARGADMRLFLNKTLGGFGTDTGEMIIGVVSGIIVFFIIAARIWESLPG